MKQASFVIVILSKPNSMACRSSSGNTNRSKDDEYGSVLLICLLNINTRRSKSYAAILQYVHTQKADLWQNSA